ncbi:MAG: carbamoyltransferase [Mariniblastus sp.]
MTVILGISAFYHDSAAALLIDGVMVAAAQEERFSRKKHDESFPTQAIAYCLTESGLQIEDIDHVAFYEKPFLKFERILETQLAVAPRGLKSFLTAMPIWLKSKLYLSRAIRKGLENRYKKRIVFPEHHESHAASAFFASPFDDAAILTVDGVGEWATTTMGFGDDNKIELTHELIFPDSLGLLYSAFTYFCGFRVNGGEGKLMGLAPYGNPVYADKILKHIVDVKSDGSIRLNQDYFNYTTGDTMTSRKFDQLFDGPARVPESKITQREMDLASSIQSVTESTLLQMASHLHHQTGRENLCIAGGVALNCVANGRIRRESEFKNVWVQPAAGDSGGAIGAAMFVWHQLLRKPRNKETQTNWTPLSGHKCVDVESKLESLGASFQKSSSRNELYDSVAKQIADQKVVGWVQGRMELGPRALGNRSILADPRDPDMQATLNQKIKFREPFRPFAPVVIDENVGDYFEDKTPSPFMLFASSVCGSKRQVLPAVTHVDGSARVQTVSRFDNEPLFELLKSFEIETGCPVLLNTSFNVRGEPIVSTVEDMFRCFMKTGMDVLVIEDCLLLKTDQPSVDELQCLLTLSPKPVPLLQKLSSIFSTLTFPIRWLVSRLALSLVYFIFITPIGLVWQKVNRDDSFQDIDRQRRSYWRSRETRSNKSSYFKQY